MTGATGFVGQRLLPALVGLGYEPVCASRDPASARQKWPDYTWVHLNVHDPSTMRVLEGCRSAFYLVHSIGEGGDYARRECKAASAFARAAAAAQLERIVYLGGVRPPSGCSTHLKARLGVGQALRAGPVSVVELRAGMLIGHGSASWTIVSTLAARLPAMLLPSWLDNHSWPVGIEDTLLALLSALELEPGLAGCYSLPGPERISHRDLLARTAAARGKRPFMLRVPLVSPRLASYWIRGVTGVSLNLVQELVAGIRCELDPSTPSFWPLIKRGPQPLDSAILFALNEAGVSCAA